MPPKISNRRVVRWDEITEVGVLHPVSDRARLAAKAYKIGIDVETERPVFECPICHGYHYANRSVNAACLNCYDDEGTQHHITLAVVEGDPTHIYMGDD